MSPRRSRPQAHAPVPGSVSLQRRFGDLVQRAREGAGATQEQAATVISDQRLRRAPRDRTNYTQSWLSRIERGLALGPSQSDSWLFDALLPMFERGLHLRKEDLNRVRAALVHAAQ